MDLRPGDIVSLLTDPGRDAGGKTPSVYFHVRCFGVWDLERRAA
jgi:hypothetical protein